MANWSETGDNLTTADNVGIGTDNPQSKLHTNGVLSVTPGSGNDSRIALGLGSDGFSLIRSVVVPPPAGPHLSPLTLGSALSFATFPIVGKTVMKPGVPPAVAVDRLTITADGNVGVGTATPTTKLQVAGDVTATNITTSGNVTAADVTASGNVTAANVVTSGNVTVAGDVILTGADCAEEFDVTAQQQLEPGTVVVIDQHGSLVESSLPYDRKVAGVVSGGGTYRPALLLDKQTPTAHGRAPIALLGKVFCKVDAGYCPIEVGDLLTTSPTPGHAMKATDSTKSFGAVIGKALHSLPNGSALVPILIALQ